MEVYVDDMLVKSKQSSSHIANQMEAFEVLRQYQMKVTQKNHFWRSIV